MLLLQTNCDSFELWIKTSTAVVAIAVMITGLLRYWKGQIWKKNEFVAFEFDKFNNDKRIRTTKYMLDWTPGRIELFPDHPKYDKRFAEITYETLISALEEHENDRKFTPEEVAIRDHFDYFLDYLEKFQQFIISKLITPKHVRPYLLYWVKKIKEDGDREEKYKLGPEVRSALHDYIRRYEFNGIYDLFANLGHPLPNPPDDKQPSGT